MRKLKTNINPVTEMKEKDRDQKKLKIKFNVSNCK